MRATIPVFLSVISLASPGAAGPIEDVNSALERGDYDTALRLVRPLAKRRNAEAGYDLGVMYLNGNGVRQSDAAAMNWFRKAADQDFPEAQYRTRIPFRHQCAPQ
jgi:TPR repeat protein